MECNKQQGAALISALLILAICGALAAFVLTSQRFIINEAQMGFGSDRLTLMLHGAQDWAIEMVQTHKDLHKVKGLKQELNGVRLTGMIYNLDGRFNLNSLADTSNIPRFTKLIKALSPDTSKERAQAVAMNLSRWVAQNERLSHAEEGFAEAQDNFPYPHQYMVDLSELRLLPGMTYPLYAKLVRGRQPYVSALPQSDFKININYATLYSFLALDNVTLSQAQQLLSCRSNNYFNNVDDFVKQCAQGMQLNTGQLIVDNHFFLVVGDAVQGQQHMHMQALLNLYLENNKPKVKIIWQEYNGE